MNNPYGAQPRPLRPGEERQYSGFTREVRVGHPERIAIDLAKIAPAGYTGLAALSIAVKDVSAEPAAPPVAAAENTVLIGNVSWGSGGRGGSMLVDLTRGGLIPVGGTDHIGIDLELVSSIVGEAPVLWRTKRVEVTVNWFGNANENPSYTSPGIRMGGAGPSDYFAIPPMASTVIVDTDTPATLATLFLELSTNRDPAGSGIKYRTPPNPNATGTKIHSGVEFVRFVTPGAGIFYFVWELH